MAAYLELSCKLLAPLLRGVVPVKDKALFFQSFFLSSTVLSAVLLVLREQGEAVGASIAGLLVAALFVCVIIGRTELSEDYSSYGIRHCCGGSSIYNRKVSLA